MKLLKPSIILFLTVLLFTSCQRNLGLEGPSGTYLYLNLNLPESGDSEGARFIHSESDELTVSLTYPGEDPIVAEFELNSSNPGPILVEDLKPGTDVLLEISVGLAESGIVLSSASTTLDIVAGANSPASLTLAALTYTIHGTLYNDADQILKDQAIWLEGAETPVMTDANGNFTLSLSTEDLVPDEYLKFSLYVSEITYDIARTNLYLLQNREDFKLKAHPEINLDFTVKCGEDSFAGVSYELWDDVGDFPIASGIADANGRIVYQDFEYNYTGGHNIYLQYNNMFEQENIIISGAPGAVVDDVEIKPYIFLSGYSNNTLLLHRMDSLGSEQHVIISDLVTPGYIDRTKIYVDYLGGQIYIWVRDGGIYNYYIGISDSWNSGFVSYDISGVIENISTTNGYSVQQMLLLDDGNLLVVATSGAFIFNTSTHSVTTIWENPLDKPGLILNGAYQDSDRSIYALGVDRLGSTPSEQKIYKLSIDGSFSEYKSLPSDYNSFSNENSINNSTYIYPIGIHEWDSNIVSVSVQATTGSSSGGKVLFFDPSSSWSQSKTPIDSDPDDESYSLLIPIGVLPDNKFYFVEEEVNKRNVYKLDSSGSPIVSFFQSYSDSCGCTPYDTFSYHYDETIGPE